MDNKRKVKFPKNFFTQTRPHVDKNNDKRDYIPFCWSENVVKGKTKVEIVSLEKSNNKYNK